MENMSIHAKTQLWKGELEEESTVNARDILSGQIVNTSLFYIPHSEEIVMTDPIDVALLAERQQVWLDKYEQDVTAFDS